MGKELIISSTRHETKVAILEDDELVEIFFQRANEYSLAGSIHKGRVTRVLPGMQSAFVDIGLERDAFLYVSDFFEENEEYERIPVGTEERAGRAGRSESIAAGPAAGPAPAGGPPPGPTDRGDLTDGRDRSGRRARHRRPRDRGFAESKYAFDRPGPSPRGGEETFQPRAPEEFPLLPGESLAKYRPAEEPAPPAADDSPAAWAEPEAPVPAADTESADEVRLAPADAPEPDPQEDPEPAGEPGGQAEPEVETAAAPAGSEPEQALEASAPAEEVEPARTPVSLTATLREQGYRYMPRITRRTRRKMRGGFPESRAEQAPEPRPQPAPEPPEERPEGPRGPRAERPPLPSIAELLREGQEVVVQIAKEPLAQKGARITSHIALPGRFVVYMPTVEHLGVSRKVASDDERHRLKRILQAHRAGMPGGFIVRTAGEGRSENDIARDMQFLYNLWLDIRQKAETRPAPALLHHDLDLVERILRDQMTDNFRAVWMDNEEVYEKVLRFVERLQPAAVGRVKMYTRPAPIFDAFHVSAELEKALRPKVWLKSGGYIVVNQTEALVAIDVNTGKFVGKSDRLEDTILKTNTEAIKEIVRQIRLRDLGGIIVVDFIDMEERRNRQRVMQALEEAMRADRAPSKILQFNDFGQVAITRKRVKQSLERTLCAPCPYCEGAGYVKSLQTVVGDILQEAHKIAGAVEGKDVVLRVSPEVARVLKSSDTDYLEELEEILGRPVLVTGDPTLHQEKFDLA